MTFLSCCNFTVIITARNRCLGQGNIFRSMCHSVHGGRGLCMMLYPDWLPGTMLLLGASVPGPIFLSRGGRGRGSLSRGVSVKGTETPSVATEGGGGASHWNAYLFHDRSSHEMYTFYSKWFECSLKSLVLVSHLCWTPRLICLWVFSIASRVVWCWLCAGHTRVVSLFTLRIVVAR